MFFTPCFYCNVSDAWLIPEKSKRLWITAAGGYCDLCMWAAAVAVWRVTHQDTLINYVAWVVMSVCGFRGLINLNPLMRLDGYYLLSDWLEMPNLRRRSHERWMSIVRWALWGAAKPRAEPKGRLLTIYGGFRWVFYVAFLDVMYLGLCRWLGRTLGNRRSAACHLLRSLHHPSFVPRIHTRGVDENAEDSLHTHRGLGRGRRRARRRAVLREDRQPLGRLRSPFARRSTSKCGLRSPASFAPSTTTWANGSIRTPSSADSKFRISKA